MHPNESEPLTINCRSLNLNMDHYHSIPDSVVPLTNNASETLDKLHKLLYSFLPYTSKIIIYVNLLCPVLHVSYSEIKINLICTYGHGVDSRFQVIALHKSDSRHVGSILTERYCHENSETLNSNQPIAIHYEANEEYLGTILILGSIQSNNNDLISQILSDKENQFQRLFLDSVKNAQIQNPYPYRFCEIIAFVVKEYSLTRRQQEIFVYHIFGKSYSEIGELLSISKNTIHNHISAIYIKTNTRNIGDLYIKFFTPTRSGQIERK